jgi:hypothetical protein
VQRYTPVFAGDELGMAPLSSMSLGAADQPAMFRMGQSEGKREVGREEGGGRPGVTTLFGDHHVRKRATSVGQQGLFR